MPVIARFLGISVYVYFRDHAPPHIHVRYGGDWAVIDAERGTCLEGSLPRHTLLLVKRWLARHRAQVREAWNDASEGRTPRRIGGRRTRRGR